MKTGVLLYFSLSFLCAFRCCAQEDSLYFTLINDFIKAIQDEGTIFYSDKPMKDVFRKHFKAVSLTLKDVNPDRGRNLKITVAEQSHILRQMKKSLTSKLPDNLFNNSKRISADGICEFVFRLSRNIYDSLISIPDSAAAFKYIRSIKQPAFFFTHPIYIRNKSILICYFMWYINSSGEEWLGVYKKEGNKWVKWSIISGSAW